MSEGRGGIEHPGCAMTRHGNPLHATNEAIKRRTATPDGVSGTKFFRSTFCCSLSHCTVRHRLSPDDCRAVGS